MAKICRLDIKKVIVESVLDNTLGKDNYTLSDDASRIIQKDSVSFNEIIRGIKEVLPYKVIGDYSDIEEGLIGRKQYQTIIGKDTYVFEMSNYNYEKEDGTHTSYYDIDFTVNGSEELVGTGVFDKSDKAKEIIQAIISQNFGNDTIRFNVEESKKGKQRLLLYKRLMNQLGYTLSNEMEYALFYNIKTNINQITIDSDVVKINSDLEVFVNPEFIEQEFQNLPEESKNDTSVDLSKDYIAFSQVKREDVLFIENVFPELDKTILQDRILNKLGQELNGLFLKDVLLINSNSPIGTGYHEAWHRFSQIYLTKNEKIRLYETIRDLKMTFQDKKSGKLMNSANANFLDIEELLAEEFKEYKSNPANYNFDKFKKEKNFFQKIFEEILKFLGAFKNNNPDLIEKYFTQLSENTFTKTNFSYENIMFDELYDLATLYKGPEENGKRIQLFSLTEGKTLSRIVDTMLAQTLKAQGLDISYYFSENSEFKRSDLHNQIKNILKAISEYKEVEDDRINDVVIHQLSKIDIRNKDNTSIKDFQERLKMTAENDDYANHFIKSYYYASSFRTLQLASKKITEALEDKAEGFIDENITNAEEFINYGDTGNFLEPSELASSAYYDMLAALPVLDKLDATNQELREDIETLLTGFITNGVFDNEAYKNFINKYNGTLAKNSILPKIGIYNEQNIQNILLKQLQGKDLDLLKINTKQFDEDGNFLDLEINESWMEAMKQNPTIALIYMEIIKLKNTIDNTFSKFEKEKAISLLAHFNKMLSFHRVPQVSLNLNNTGQEYFYSKITEDGETIMAVSDNLISPVIGQYNSAVTSTRERIIKSFQNIPKTKENVVRVQSIQQIRDLLKNPFTSNGVENRHYYLESTGEIYFNHLAISGNKNYVDFDNEGNGVMSQSLLNNDDTLYKFFKEFGIILPENLSNNDINSIRKIADTLVKSIYQDFKSISQYSQDVLPVTQPLSHYMNITVNSENFAIQKVQKFDNKQSLTVVPKLMELGEIIADYNNSIQSSVVQTNFTDKSVNENYRTSNLWTFKSGVNEALSIEELITFNGLLFYDMNNKLQLQSSKIMNYLFKKDNSGKYIKKENADLTIKVLNDVLLDNDVVGTPFEKLSPIDRLYSSMMLFATEGLVETHIKETGNTHFAWSTKNFPSDLKNDPITYFKSAIFVYKDQLERGVKNPQFSVFSTMFEEFGTDMDNGYLNKFKKGTLSNFDNNVALQNSIKAVFSKFIENQVDEIFKVVAESSSPGRVEQLYNTIKAFTAPADIEDSSDLYDPSKVTSAIKDFLRDYITMDYNIAQEEAILFTGDVTEFKNILKRSKFLVSNGTGMDSETGMRTLIQEIGIGLKTASLYGDKIEKEDLSEHDFKVVVLKSKKQKDKGVEKNKDGKENLHVHRIEKISFENYIKIVFPSIYEKHIKNKPDWENSGIKQLQEYADILKAYEEDVVNVDGAGRMTMRALKIAYVNKNVMNNRMNEDDPNNITPAEFFFLQEAWAKHCAISKGDIKGVLTKEESDAVIDFKRNGLKYHPANIQKFVIQGPTSNTRLATKDNYEKRISEVNDGVFYKMGLQVMLPTEYMDDKSGPKTTNHMFYELIDRENVDFVLDSESVKARKYEELWLDLTDEDNNLSNKAVQALYDTSRKNNHDGYVMSNVQISTKFVKEQLNKDSFKNSAPGGSQRYFQWLMDKQNIIEELKNDPNNKALQKKLEESEEVINDYVTTAGDILNHQYNTFLKKAGINLNEGDLILDKEKFVEYIVENLKTSDNVFDKDLVELMDYIKSSEKNGISKLDLEFSKYHKQISTLLYAEFTKSKNKITQPGGFYTNIPESNVNSGVNRALKSYTTEDKTGKTIHAESIMTFNMKYHENLFNLPYKIENIGNREVKLKINQRLRSKDQILPNEKIVYTFTEKKTQYYIVRSSNFNDNLDRLNEKLSNSSFRTRYTSSLEMIHQRIPHSSPNFSVFTIPVKFLHPMNGQVIALPKNLIKSIGFDFDIDNMPTAVKYLGRNGLPLGQDTDLLGQSAQEIYTEEDYKDFEKEYFTLQEEYDEKMASHPQYILDKATESIRDYIKILMEEDLIVKYTPEDLENLSYNELFDILEEANEKKFDSEGNEVITAQGIIESFKEDVDNKELQDYVERVYNAELIYNSYADQLYKEFINEDLLKELNQAKRQYLDYPKYLSNQFLTLDINRMREPHNYTMLRKTDNMDVLTELIEEVEKLFEIKSDKNSNLPHNQISTFQNLINHTIIKDRQSLGTFLIAATNILLNINNGDLLNKSFRAITSSKLEKFYKAIKDSTNKQQVDSAINELYKSGDIKIRYPLIFSNFTKDSDKIDIPLYNNVYDEKGNIIKRESSQYIYSLLATSLLDILNNDTIARGLNISHETKFALISLLSTGASLRDAMFILKNPISELYVYDKQNTKSDFKNEDRFHYVSTTNDLFGENSLRNSYGTLPAGPRGENLLRLKVDGELNQYLSTEDANKAFSNIIEQYESKRTKKELKENMLKFIQFYNKESDKVINSLKSKGFKSSDITKKQIFTEIFYSFNKVTENLELKKEMKDMFDLAKYSMALFAVSSAHGSTLFSKYLTGTPNNIKLEGYDTLIKLEKSEIDKVLSDVMTINQNPSTKSPASAYANKDDIKLYLDTLVFQNFSNLNNTFKSGIKAIIRDIERNDPIKTQKLLTYLNEYVFQNYFRINNGPGSYGIKDIVENFIIGENNYTQSFLEIVKKIDEDNGGGNQLSESNLLQNLKTSKILPIDFVGDKINFNDKNSVKDYLETPIDIFTLTLSGETVLKNEEKKILSEELENLENIDYIAQMYNASEENAMELVKQVRLLKIASMFINNPLSYSNDGVSQLLSDSYIRNVYNISYDNFIEEIGKKDSRVIQASAIESITNNFKQAIQQITNITLYDEKTVKVYGFKRAKANPFYLYGRNSENVNQKLKAKIINKLNAEGLPVIEHKCK